MALSLLEDSGLSADTYFDTAASVLLKIPCAHIDFVHRALVVACIHGCCSRNVVQHIVNAHMITMGQCGSVYYVIAEC